MTSTERRAAATALASIPDNEPCLLIATGRYIGEGFDDAWTTGSRVLSLRD